jgi:hypothetical protein
MIKADEGWTVVFTHRDGSKGYIQVAAWNEQGVAMVVDMRLCRLVDIFSYAVERFDELPDIRLAFDKG